MLHRARELTADTDEIRADLARRREERLAAEAVAPPPQLGA